MPTDCQSKKDDGKRKQLIKELMGVAEVCVLFAETYGLDIGITRAQLNALPKELRVTSHRIDG